MQSAVRPDKVGGVLKAFHLVRRKHLYQGGGEGDAQNVGEYFG